MSPSPIRARSVKKKNSPNPARMDSACRAPSDPDGLAGLYYPVRYCYLPLKQWVVQFDNENYYLLIFFINVYTYHNPKFALTVMHIQ